MSNEAFPAEDGNFKRGAFKPVAIIIGILLVGGAALLAVLSMHGEAQVLTKEQVNKEVLEIQLLPKAEQIPRWRKWADTESEHRLQQEAFVHLAWAKDKQSIPIITKGLASADHGVRGTAAMALVDFGTPDADGAKPALLKALAEGDSSDKPQICWALVALKEPSAFDAILGEYRLGHLANVQRLDGFPAFDATALASLTSIDKVAALAGDESDSVRQLVATTLSRTGDAKWTDTLIKLVKDKEVEVAREAAVGLGKIGNDKATQPLVSALSKADKGSREKFLQALRDGIGAPGLVLALKTISHEKADTEKFQTKQIFDMLKELEDPRGRRRSLRVHPDEPQAALEGRGGDAHGRDRRRARRRGPRLAHGAGPAQALQRRRLARAPARRQRARLRRAHARGPRHHPPREARLPPQDRRAGRPLLGRPREQAPAARERDALPRGGRLAEGDPAAREVGRSEGQAAERGRAAAVPRDVGHGAERAPLPGLDQGPRPRLEHPREAAAPPQQEDRRVVGLAHAGRPHHPRHDAPRARRRRVRRVRPVGRPEGLRRSREVHRGPDGERAGAHGGVLRAFVGGDRRPDEGGRQEGPRQHEDGPEGEPPPPVLPRDRRPPAGPGRDGGARGPALGQRAGHRSAPPDGARDRHGRDHARRWCRPSSRS